ncbi:uncharacterized protein [Drosophila virilis]|uniref:Uncharacterized protein n=1 Tax=Drosophila virilis TaxID=7244 RepID=A0A0Q9WAE6_DROVI|nr:uncharacterized protein LOC26531422 [Drosophila virilis]KRF81715.1 uncharacterized protein Dvir_GJ26652 [Drosophila virilis]
MPEPVWKNGVSYLPAKNGLSQLVYSKVVKIKDRMEKEPGIVASTFILRNVGSRLAVGSRLDTTPISDKALGFSKWPRLFLRLVGLWPSALLPPYSGICPPCLLHDQRSAVAATPTVAFWYTRGFDLIPSMTLHFLLPFLSVRVPSKRSLYLTWEVFFRLFAYPRPKG